MYVIIPFIIIILKAQRRKLNIMKYFCEETHTYTHIIFAVIRIIGEL